MGKLNKDRTRGSGSAVEDKSKSKAKEMAKDGKNANPKMKDVKKGFGKK